MENEQIKKVCPTCGSDTFIVQITKAGYAKYVLNEDTQQYEWQIITESDKIFDIQVARCANHAGGCSRVLTEADLINGMKCNKCGRIVAPCDLTENGLCIVCDAKDKDPSLESKSKDDIIMELIKARQAAQTISDKKTTEVENSNKTVNNIKKSRAKRATKTTQEPKPTPEDQAQAFQAYYNSNFGSNTAENTNVTIPPINAPENDIPPAPVYNLGEPVNEPVNDNVTDDSMYPTEEPDNSVINDYDDSEELF